MRNKIPEGQCRHDNGLPGTVQALFAWRNARFET